MDIVYKFEGPAVDEGIDLFRLSPLLLSIGELIQEGQNIVHPNGRKLGVNIKPFGRGSFVIELSVFAQTSYQQLLDAVSGESISEVKELLEWLGIISGGGYGLIKLYKYLKGPPKKIEEVGPDEVRITPKDKNSITVNKQTYSLFQDSTIQKSIYNIYGNFLGNEGVERVSSYDKSNKKKTEVVVSKKDVAYFNPANAIVGEMEDNEKKNITTVFLNAKRVSLEGEPDNWSFRKGKGEIVRANVKDLAFLDKVKSGKIRLTSGDLLEVTLVEIQTVDDTGQVNTKNEIVSVINYKKAPVQSSLLETSPKKK